MLSTLLMYDDENFTVQDNIKRRRLYRPLIRADELAQFDETRRPEHLFAVNFMAKDFRFDGATQWNHLKQDAYDLLSVLYNSYSFASGAKDRVTTTIANATAQRRQQQRLPGIAGDDQSEVATDVSDRQMRNLQGADQLSLRWETLVRHDGKGLQVVGYRAVFSDRSVVDQGGMDLMTKGLLECEAEAIQMKNEYKAEMKQLNKSAGGRSKSGGQYQSSSGRQQTELKAHYAYCTRMESHSMFLTLCGKHFSRDDLLWQQAPHQLVMGSEGTGAGDGEQQMQPFIDRRDFLSHNRGANGPESFANAAIERYQRRVNETLPLIFSKETAMVYHVESAQVMLPQRCLACYCSESEAAINQAMEAQMNNQRNPERLIEMMDQSPDDRQFTQFPMRAITYSFDTRFCCSEMLPHTPLPHRLGTYLYTTADRDHVRRRIDMAQTRHQRARAQDLYGDGDDVEEMEVEENGPINRDGALPLGLHDVEMEVTPEMLHNHPQYISDDVMRHLTDSSATTAVSENVKASFMNRASGDVDLSLQAVLQTVREKRVYMTEVARRADESVTEPEVLRNHDKRHALDKRVAAVVGRNEKAKIKDRQQMLASCNLAYYRQIIGKWRPIAATVESVLHSCRNLKYDPVFLARDIYWVLDSLNDEGFANIDRAYYDANGQIPDGKLAEYLYEKRLFIEAITAELFHEFMNNPTVDPANLGIRADLKKTTTQSGHNKRHRLGMRMTLMKYDKQVMPFHAYMLWMYSYYTELCGIARLYKPMNIVFHNKYHHCRTYSPGTRDPKNNTVMLGHGMVGKSWLLLCVRMSCPTDVVMAISHWTTQAFNTDTNFTNVLMIQDEMTNKLLGQNNANKNNAGHSDAGQDDARNNGKERATSHESQTMEFYRDEETGQRRMRLSKAQNQFVMLGASNVPREDVDPNVLSRFICLTVARSIDEMLGDRAQDKTKYEIGQDGEISTQHLEEVREVHRLYFLVECAMKAGITQNKTFGVAMNAAQIYIGKFLDLMSAKYGINTNNIRKRKFILELARTLCIAKACWWVLKSPEECHLFYDPYTHEYIGLNPRVVLDGVLKLLVVGKGEVVMALTMLSSLWSHEHEEKMLATFAIKLCGLDKLKDSGFLQRAADEQDDSTALMNYDRRRKAAFNAGSEATGGVVSGMAGPISDCYTTDYTYVKYTMKSKAEIYSLIVATMPDVCITASEVSYMLREMEKMYITSDSYKKEKGSDGQWRLVASGNPENIKRRKVVDKGKDARTGLDTIAINVGFLKQKLSHLLPDSLIQDLTVRHYERPQPQPAPVSEKPPAQRPMSVAGDMEVDGHGEEEDEEEPPTEDLDEEPAERNDPTQALAQLHERLQKVLVIQKNTDADTPVMKVIREVLEHDILQWTGEQTEEQDAQDAEDYADVITGRNPCLTFVTADAPQPQKTEALFPDLMAEYQQVPGYNKELRLDSKLAVLELERKRGCRPFVTYNFNTATAGARSSLNVYDGEEAEDEDEATVMALIAGTDVTPLELDEWRQHRREERRLEAAEARAEQLVVAKNQYKMYSETPVFYSVVDLDYDECRRHLLAMAYPESVARRNGRLCNFEPHMYYNMMDHRRKRELHTGKHQPLVPLYADIVSQVSAQRRIIEAALDRTPVEERRTYTQLCGANYSAADLKSAPGQSGPTVYVRRGAELSARRMQEKALAMASLTQKNRLSTPTLTPHPQRPALRTRPQFAQQLPHEQQQQLPGRTPKSHRPRREPDANNRPEKRPLLTATSTTTTEK